MHGKFFLSREALSEREMKGASPLKNYRFLFPRKAQDGVRKEVVELTKTNEAEVVAGAIKKNTCPHEEEGSTSFWWEFGNGHCSHLEVDAECSWCTKSSCKSDALSVETW